jgi:hypothetical protein
VHATVGVTPLVIDVGETLAIAETAGSTNCRLEELRHGGNQVTAHQALPLD